MFPSSHGVTSCVNHSFHLILLTSVDATNQSGVGCFFWGGIDCVLHGFGHWDFFFYFLFIRMELGQQTKTLAIGKTGGFGS